MIRMTWTELSFTLEAEGEWVAPRFAGSMCRGALAAALRRLVCVMHRPVCDGCSLVRACLYPRLFETRPDAGAGVMRRYSRAPHPVVIVAALRDLVGRADGSPTVETFTIRLFGPDAAGAPFLIRAAEDMARRGLGRDRVPFRLTAIGEGRGGVRVPDGYTGPEMRPPPPRLPTRQRWRLLSPLRIVGGGRLLDAESLDGPALGRAVLRRVGLMAQFYGRIEPGLDFRALADQAGRVKLDEPDLRWLPLRRYSSRQRAQQSLGGLVGSFILDFGEAPDLARLADWVPVVHLGKDTSQGLGHVAVEAA